VLGLLPNLLSGCCNWFHALHAAGSALAMLIKSIALLLDVQ
jgi:hypothetical protein